MTQLFLNAEPNVLRRKRKIPCKSDFVTPKTGNWNTNYKSLLSKSKNSMFINSDGGILWPKPGWQKTDSFGVLRKNEPSFRTRHFPDNQGGKGAPWNLWMNVYPQQNWNIKRPTNRWQLIKASNQVFRWVLLITEMDRNGPKWTEMDRNGLKCTE